MNRAASNKHSPFPFCPSVSTVPLTTAYSAPSAWGSQCTLQRIALPNHLKRSTFLSPLHWWGNQVTKRGSDFPRTRKWVPGQARSRIQEFHLPALPVCHKAALQQDGNELNAPVLHILSFLGTQSLCATGHCIGSERSKEPGLPAQLSELYSTHPFIHGIYSIPHKYLPIMGHVEHILYLIGNREFTT